MAQNNSSVSAAGTVRSPGVGHGNRSTLSSSSALQLFLKQRRRALRKTSGPNFVEKSFTTSPLILDPAFSSSTSEKVKTGTLNIDRLSSIPSRVDIRHLTKALLRHRLSRANPLSLAKLGRLYRRHRNPERALDLFLLRRLLWRSTRRPGSMDFIEHLRRSQADEPSSDEESGLTLPSLSASDRSRRSSSTDSTVITVPDQSDGETKVSSAKRKRNFNGDVVEEDAATASRAAKRAKAYACEDDEVPASPMIPATQPKLPKPPRAPSSGDARTGTAKGEQERPAKSVKREKDTPAKQAPRTAAGNAHHVTMSAAAGGSSSKATATTPQQIKKPIGQMEFFERRRYEILEDPLGFGDCVYDTTKSIPRHAAKSFAQHRRRQKGLPPPLEMSGALGPPDEVGDDAKPSGKGFRRPESLAKEAQKRAHQQKVGQKVQALMGKSGSGGSERTAVEGKRPGSIGGKQAGTGRSANGKGKGKEKEKSFASTESRQTPSVKQRGGQQWKVKYTKFS
ncbi:uncharacterized protein B0T15DRAFT_10258 [Chaetomium strumarium]|uniref:Uncharacterized protein n=1 Tax=Chaetomium strumarium TaxID=1170767 RepID=A0AAJ0M5H8_9PEZI|nr:hypothetical protein B0T15DRAFT_10258 [Chaetomium strumarium]